MRSASPPLLESQFVHVERKPAEFTSYAALQATGLKRVRAGLAYGVVPSKLLLDAAKKGQVNAVRELLASPGVKVNGVGDESWDDNPLCCACDGNWPEVVRELLTRPLVDARWTDAKGYSQPLHVAARWGATECVKALLSHVDVNDRTADEKTSALMKACFGVGVDCVRFLLAHPQVEVNLVDESDNTALSYAVCRHSGPNIDIIRLLLSHPKVEVTYRARKALRDIENEASRVQTKALLDAHDIHA